jgi:D-sedoheptulose 7-phosphate isomerase
MNQDLALAEFVRQEAAEHQAAFDALLSGAMQPFESILELWYASLRAGGKLLLFGNGGSAADCQHIAAEFVIRYKDDRPAIAAIALTTDSSTLTACGNDLGFDALFARQVEALGRPGDVVLGISTSGRSPNVLAGLRQARSMGLRTTGLAGGTGGAMATVCDALLVVPSTVTARIQEMHIFLGHMLCKSLEARLTRS